MNSFTFNPVTSKGSPPVSLAWRDLFPCFACLLLCSHFEWNGSAPPRYSPPLWASSSLSFLVYSPYWMNERIPGLKSQALNHWTKGKQPEPPTLAPSYRLKSLVTNLLFLAPPTPPSLTLALWDLFKRENTSANAFHSLSLFFTRFWKSQRKNRVTLIQIAIDGAVNNLTLTSETDFADPNSLLSSVSALTILRKTKDSSRTLLERKEFLLFLSLNPGKRACFGRKRSKSPI